MKILTRLKNWLLDDKLKDSKLSQQIGDSMQARDKLNSIENYLKTINFNRETIKEWQQKIENVLEDEKNGIQRSSNTNADVVETTRYSIALFQKDILLATYSAGFPIDGVKQEFFYLLAFMKHSWKHRGGYISMLNMLSIAIIQDWRQAQDELYEIYSDPKRQSDFVIKDYLLDFLFQKSGLGNKVYMNFMIAKPYAILKDVIESAETDKAKAVKKLKSYLQKNWFSALKRQELIQETHTSPYGTHCGYWSFESGALVKVLGLDDSLLQEQQYYPYDLVHEQGT